MDKLCTNISGVMKPLLICIIRVYPIDKPKRL